MSNTPINELPLVDILTEVMYRIEETNGLEFCSPDLRRRVAQALLDSIGKE